MLVAYGVQVILSHSLSATLAEWVFSQKGFRFPGLYGTLEFATFAIAPCLFSLIWRGPTFVAKLFHQWDDDNIRFILCGILMAASHSAGLAAYCFINYSTAMLFSSAKLPSLMLVGALFHRPNHQNRKAYLMSACVALGLGLFAIAEQRDTPRFNAFGLFLVALNIALGSVLYNVQQRILHRPVAGTIMSSTERSFRTQRLMFFQYTTASIACMVYTLLSGELVTAVAWCRARRGLVIELLPILCGAVLTSIGVRALLRTTADFDVARAGVITSSRKACTFVLSFVVFPKPFSMLHFAGILLIVTGSLGVHRSLEGERILPLSKVASPRLNK